MARIGNNTSWNNYNIVFQVKTSTDAQTQTQTSVYYRLIMKGTKLLANETIADSTNGPGDNTLLGYMMTQALSQAGGSTSQTSNVTIPEITQVFSSTNNFVFLFKVSYATQTLLTFRPILSPITYGQKVLIAGNLTDMSGNPLSGPQVVDIENSVDGGSTWNRVDEIPVNPNGSYNYTWAPEAGNYTVRVQYPGQIDVYMAALADQALVVSKASVNLGITVSTTTPSLGQNEVITWQMSPPVPGANTTLYYTTNNKTLVKIASLIMNSSSISYTWKVTVSGTFSIVVAFEGDNNYNPATNSIQLKTA